MTCEFLVGVRDERPALLEHARALDAGVLISANAFNRRWTRRMRDADEPFPGFKPAATDGRWAGLRVHLDSGGFVAARQFGDFHFMTHGNPECYVALATSLVAAGADLGWWASADLCCEPEIAADHEEILLRLARNAHAYDTLCDIADAHGFPQPMPVLQGRSPTDYQRSFDLLFDHRAPQELPAVMGVGSMCRRPAGELVRTLDALDRTLPAGIRLHLFGVTSDAMRRIAGFQRVASTDSSSYDLADRREALASGARRSNASLVAAMTRFVARQRGAIGAPDRTPLPRELPIHEPLRLRHQDLGYRLAFTDLLARTRAGDAGPLDWHHAFGVGELSRWDTSRHL